MRPVRHGVPGWRGRCAYRTEGDSNGTPGRELDDVAVDLPTRLKAAFAPAGILNPDKSVPLR